MPPKRTPRAGKSAPPVSLKRSPRIQQLNRKVAEKAPDIPEEHRAASFAHLNFIQRQAPQFGVSISEVTEEPEEETVQDQPRTPDPAPALDLPPTESSYYSEMSLVSSTPVTATQPKEKHINDRIADKQFCNGHFPGHTSIAPSIDDIVCLMGGEALRSRYIAACEIAHTRVTPTVVEKFKAYVRAESKGQKDINWLLNIYRNGYWMNEMADYARPEGLPPASFEFVRGDTKLVPLGRFIQSRRKPDVGLICAGVAKPLQDDQAANEFTWNNLLVLGELTVADVSRSQIYALATDKYRQLVTNMVDLLLEQANRHFVIGFSIHNDHFVFALLDHEGLYHCFIEHAVSSENLHRILALWDTMRSASIYELGHSPLFHYHFHFPSGNLVVDQLIIPPNLSHDGLGQTFNVKGLPINPMTHIPFHRATAVWEVELAGAPRGDSDKSLYAKLQWVAEDRMGREVAALRQLADGGASLPSWAPKLVAWLITQRLTCQLPLSDFRQMDPFGRLTKRIRTARHVEVIVTETLADGQRLSHSHATTDTILSIAEQLFIAINEALMRNVLHRDISSGNVLSTPDGRLVWIDWECAAPVDTAGSSRQRTGTIDTMSIDVLEASPGVHSEHQELESGVYLIWKYTMTSKRLEIKPEDKAIFKDREGKYGWEARVDPNTLADSRSNMWGQAARIGPPRSRRATARDLVMMAKSLPAEVATIHALSQIPPLNPNEKLGSGRPIRDLYDEALPVIIKVCREMRNGGGMRWATELGIVPP